MKSKILTLIIGILIGAIIATSGFLIYTKVNEKSRTNNGQMMMRGRGDKPGMFPQNQNGEDSSANTEKSKKQKGNAVNNTESSNTENGELLAMPGGEAPSGEAPNGIPPEMPSGGAANGTPPQMPSGGASNGTAPQMQSNNQNATL